jgi:hypothetical protein
MLYGYIINKKGRSFLISPFFEEEISIKHIFLQFRKLLNYIKTGCGFTEIRI